MADNLTLREAFGLAITKIASERDDFVVLDADVAGGTGTSIFKDNWPERFIQCGIAEQNMMGVAAGLSTTGIIPIFTAYAVFTALRAIEQARNSIAYPELNVKIVASHLGLDVGPDGPTHQCIEDIAIYRAIPNFLVLAPADQYEMEDAVRKMLAHNGPVYLRTGRSSVEDIYQEGKKFIIGKSDILEDGNDVTIFACQKMVKIALNTAKILAKENIKARIVNLSSIKPIDKELIIDSAKKTGAFVSIEDHNIYGGLGSAIAEVVVNKYPVPMEFLGIKDVFGESGEPDELHNKYGLNEKGLVEKVRLVINRKGK